MEEIKCPQCKNRLTPPFERCWICGWEARGEEKRKAKKLYEQWMREKFGKVPGEKKEKEVVFRPRRRVKEEPRRKIPSRRGKGAVVVIEEAPAEEEIPEAIVEEVPSRERRKAKAVPAEEVGEEAAGEEEEEVIPVKCRCGHTIEVKVWEGMKAVVFRCPRCGREGKISLEEEEEEEEFEEAEGEEEIFEGVPEEEEPPRARRPGREAIELEVERPERGRRRRWTPDIFEEEEAPRAGRSRRGRREAGLFEEEEEDIRGLTYKKPPRRGEVEPKFTVTPKETTEGTVKRCPVCGRPLKWKENLELWYCAQCKEYY